MHVFLEYVGELHIISVKYKRDYKPQTLNPYHFSKIYVGELHPNKTLISLLRVLSVDKSVVLLYLLVKNRRQISQKKCGGFRVGWGYKDIAFRVRDWNVELL